MELILAGVSLGAVAIAMVLMWYAILGPQPNPPSSVDLDHQACKQMRASGWSEAEIQDFMEKHDGWYDRS